MTQQQRQRLKKEKRNQRKKNRKNYSPKRDDMRNFLNKCGDKVHVTIDSPFEEVSSDNPLLENGGVVYENTVKEDWTVEQIREYQERRTRENPRIHHIQTPEEIYELFQYHRELKNNLPPTRKSLSKKMDECEPIFNEDEVSSDEKIRIFENYFSPIFNEVIFNKLEKIKSYKMEKKKFTELRNLMYYTGEILGSDVNVYPENFEKKFELKDGVRMNHLGTHSISYNPNTEDLVIEEI